MWHTSHGHGQGSHLTILTVFFAQEWSILAKNSTVWFKKLSQKGQRPVPEVLDGNHSGLGRGWEGKNGLDAG